jgi:hypothetical protein
MEKTYCSENLMFYKEVEDLRKMDAATAGFSGSVLVLLVGSKEA